MFKWVSWVIRMGATALLLSFLCIWTTGYIVNSYMETVIKQLDLPLQTQPFALSGVWGKLWGAEKAPQEAALASNSNENKEESKQQNDQSEDKIVQESPASNASEPPSDKSLANDSIDSDPDTSSNGEPSESPEPGPEASAAPEVEDGDDNSTPVLGGQIEMKQLTESERQALYAMVVSKLKQDQLKVLSDALQGGLTAEELVQVEDMLKTALSDEEYSQMTELLEGKREADPNLSAE
ncbi:hypothetical protein [Cohnella sp.]|uniref:hypothetical protein n=1 Tax=Cohnella sp. TaxID=1883426 RepID=UPI00356679B0